MGPILSCLELKENAWTMIEHSLNENNDWTSTCSFKKSHGLNKWQMQFLSQHFTHAHFSPKFLQLLIINEEWSTVLNVYKCPPHILPTVKVSDDFTENCIDKMWIYRQNIDFQAGQMTGK